MYKTVFSVLLCNFIEWYDFVLYGHLSYLFSQIFFPSNNQYTALLLTLSAFAIGFIARPLGAVLFGYIGDKKGRKFALMTSLITMLISTAAFMVIPTFKSCGIISPILLIMIRVAQGLSFGGESGGVVLVAESVSKNQRTFICGIHPVSCICGVVLGYLIVELCSHFMSEIQFQSWGWRLPIALGFAMTVCVLYLRKGIKENIISRSSVSTNPIVDIFLRYKKKLIISSGIYSLSASSFYVFTILLNIMLLNSSEGKERNIMLYSLLMFDAAMMCIVSSIICSIFDKRKVAMLAATAFIFLSYPIFYFIELKFISAHFILAGLTGFYISSVVSISISLFDINVRQTAVSLSYNIAGALLGGTAPAICMWMIKLMNSNLAPSFYLIFCASISFVSLYLSKVNKDS